MSDEKQEDLDLTAVQKPSKLPLLLGILNLAATGVVAFKVLTLNVATPTAAEAKPAVAAPGPMVPFEPFVVNLNEPTSARYLKITFNVELDDQKAVKELENGLLQVRDRILRYLSSLKVADTLAEDGKDKIQEEILARMTNVLGDGKVRQLYFTEFVVQ